MIDPGAEFSHPKGTLAWLMAFVRRHPDCTLPAGEAKMLLNEIDRLDRENTGLQDRIEGLAFEIAHTADEA